MHSDIYESIWFKLGVMIGTNVLFYTGVIDQDLDSRSLEWEKAKTSVPIVSESFQLIWMKLGMLLRFVVVINLITILSHLLSIQGENSTYVILFKKK